MTVYFIKPVNMAGPIKIGCSKSPDNRKATLSTWSPFALEIVTTIEGGIDLERRFHARFLHIHERREWFSWAPELAEAIAAIKAGTFDISSLPEGRHITKSVGSRKDMSFATPEWRYQRSVSARIIGLRRRGMHYADPLRREIDALCGDWRNDTTCENRGEIEAIFVKLNVRFPLKGRPALIRLAA